MFAANEHSEQRDKKLQQAKHSGSYLNPATQQAEMRRIALQSQPGQKVRPHFNQ
jgi:hypothetical protein